MKVTDEMVRAALSCRPFMGRVYDDMPVFDMFHGIPSDDRNEAMRAALEAALSHAAGQDDEQCRAASGVEEIARQMDAMAGHIQASSPEQKSERLRGWASMLRALSRGVPEGK